MKKLFAFLIGLNVSLGALAYNNPKGFSGVSFQDIGSDTQFIEMTTAGSLSTWAQNETELGYMGKTSRTKLVITGPMSASDFTALSGSAWDSFTTVDLSKVTVTDPTYISNMTLANAQTIILPNGLTKEQIASLKNEASGVVAGLVGTSETAYDDHYYYTLPGETEQQEYTGTVFGSEGNYYFHETKTYQRRLTIQDGYPTFTWTDLLGETHNLTKEQAENAENGSWIPENVSVVLKRNEALVRTHNYTYTATYNDTEYVLNLNQYAEWNQVAKVAADFGSTVGETTTTTTNQEIKIYNSDADYEFVIPQNSTVTVTLTSISTNVSYQFRHLEDQWDHWMDYPATSTNVSYDEPNNRYIGTLVNGGYFLDQWNNHIEYGTAKFPISSNYKYDYTDIRNNPLQYPAEGTLSAADEDGYVDWVFDEDVALTKVQIPYNNLTEVEGMVAYVNTAGSLSNVASVFYDSDLASAYRSSENITVLGNISNADLTELGESNFASVNFLDMSGAVLTGDVTTLSSKGTAAIVLPNIQDGDEVRIVSTAEMGTLQQRKMPNDDNNYNFKCLAYLDDAAYQSSGNDHKVCVYTTQCSSLTNLSSFINTNSSLVFLPLYKTDGTLDNYMLQYNTEIANLLTYVKDLPALNIDFGMVYAGVSTDFSQLNPATHYITIPVTSTDYDFTDEVNPYNAQTGEKYIYGNNIYVVATYKNPEGIYAKSCSYAGKPFTATEPTNITYVRRAGTLAGASGTVSQEMLTATRQIFVGTLNDTDVSAMAMMRATTFDFVDATIDAEDMKAFHNGYVHYLTLPDNEESAIEATSADVCNYRNMTDNESSKCPELLSVGAYNTTTNTLTTWSSAPGNVYKVTSLIRPQVATQIVNGQEVQVRGTGNICSTLNNVVMSGTLNWDDISANNGNGKNNGLESATIKSADLTNAYFPDNSHMVFSTASWSNIEHLYLPTDERMNTIPDESMYQFQSLVELCIPYNYEHIGVNAFYNSHIPTITTTDANGNLYVGGTKVANIVNGTYYDKDGIVIPNNGVNTYTLSENLKSISTGAFNTLHGDLTDVYVLATTAPTCAADAFTKGMYDGWGGFKGNDDHPLSRATYNNNGVLFTMLHFPANVTLAQAKNYTDITRDYTLWDETGAYDGQGNLRVWPNMTEFYRAFRQAIHGVTWNANGWNTTRSAGGNVNDIQNLPSSYTAYVMDEQGQFVLDGEGNKTTAIYEPTNLYDANVNFTAANVIPATTTEAGEGNTYDTQYMGWHQFVLADYYRYKEVEKDANATYVDGQWYTICIPYDLTEEEVINLMGAPKNATYSGYGCAIESGDNAGCHLPTVYSLKKVTREYPNITLGFSQELMNQIANKNKDLVFKNTDGTIDLEDYNYQSNKEGKILIKGGYPYLIRPIFPETVKDELGNVVNFNEANEVKGNLGKYILSVSSFTDNDLGNKYEDEVAIPIISQKLIATNQGGTPITTKEAVKDENNNVLVDANQPYYYFFQGTYTKQTMPKAYFIYNGLWYRNTKDNRDWDSFTAIIGGKTTADGASIINSSGSKTGKDNFSTYFVSFKSYSDKFTQSNENGVKFNITFEDENGFDEVVAIDQINGESFNSNVNGPVYNMAGQRVGTSLEGLSKGLYIVNGKKVVVK